jgi:hypothetical protein
MGIRTKAGLLTAAVLAAAPAAAQVDRDRVGQVTQERLDEGIDGKEALELLGLLGLLGLWGLRRDSDNDGYTDDPI